MLALGFLYAAILLTLWPFDSVSHDDSLGLLHFASLHTSAYPLLLDVVGALSGNAENVVFLQVALAGLSAAFLSLCLLYRFRCQGAAWLLLIALLANPFLVRVHFWILTDSLFASFLMLILGVLLLIDAAPTLGRLLALSVLMALISDIRPLAMSLWPLWVFIFWLYWLRLPSRNLLILLAILVLPLGFIHGADKYYHHKVHGDVYHGLMNRHLFAKMVMMDELPDSALYGDEFTGAVSDFRAETLQGLSKIQLPFKRLYYLRNREVEAQHRFNREAMTAGAVAAGVNEEDFRKEIGLKAIKSQPVGYLRLILRHYLGSWTVFTDTTDLSGDMRFFGGGKMVFVRIGVAMACFLSLCSAIFGLFMLFFKGREALGPKMRICFLSSLYIHGYFLLISMAGVFVSRYTLDLWGALVLSNGLLLWMVWEALQKRRFPEFAK